MPGCICRFGDRFRDRFLATDSTPRAALELASMTAKERLRNLIDELSEQEAADALALFEKRADDPMVRALDQAPMDDEPSSEEEDVSAHEAFEEYKRGESFSADEIKRELT